MSLSRRKFLVSSGAALAATRLLAADQGKVANLTHSPFRIAVINDEITQDFGRACEVASRQFGMRWMELRGMWNKNVLKLDAAEIAEAKRILGKNQLGVTDIASPLFKVDWPGAPKSQYSPARGQFNADFTFDQQDEVLERSIELAKNFGTDRVRCFDFWRLDDPAPHRKAMNETLIHAAEKAAKRGVILLLENEPACNTATGAEAAEVLTSIKLNSFMLNWDPGNAASRGEVPYPDAYNKLPKERIGHCHCKDVAKKDDKYEWAPMGGGIIDWVGQFRALKRYGYGFAVSLETHWKGAGTAEASTVESWNGMKNQLAKAGAL